MVTSFTIILVAGIASVLVGWMWYTPSVFGNAWKRMSNFTPEMEEQGKKRMPLMAFFGLLVSMLVAYVLWYVAVAWHVFDWVGAIELAFWIWIGFFAPALIGSVLWDQKPFRLFLIHAFYWLVSLIVIALVIVIGAQLFLLPSSLHNAGDTGGTLQVAE